jgi:hypothetical protein
VKEGDNLIPRHWAITLSHTQVHRYWERDNALKIRIMITVNSYCFILRMILVLTLFCPSHWTAVLWWCEDDR